jgi:hypothetical protein
VNAKHLCEKVVKLEFRDILMSMFVVCCGAERLRVLICAELALGI